MLKYLGVLAQEASFSQFKSFWEKDLNNWPPVQADISYRELSMMLRSMLRRWQNKCDSLHGAGTAADCNGGVGRETTCWRLYRILILLSKHWTASDNQQRNKIRSFCLQPTWLLQSIYSVKHVIFVLRSRHKTNANGITRCEQLRESSKQIA